MKSQPMGTQAKQVDLKDTLAEITRRMQKLGDLPIFSATVNRVSSVSSDDDSTAMSLAMEVMKDASLSTKLLKLANSSFYNRGQGKITEISRAVVMLGFETVQNLCLTLKLIESFQVQNPEINMNQILVNALLTAGMVRDVATKAGAWDIEQTYVCGLLHGLGEIITAYSLSETYVLMEKQREAGELSWNEIQQQYLGGYFSQIGEHLAKSWEFPDAVVNTMKPYKAKSKGVLRDNKELNHALVAYSHESLELVYGRSNADEDSLGELLLKIADASGIEREDVEQSMASNFRNCCELAEDYGLKNKLLMPTVNNSSDALLNKTTRQFAFYAGSLGSKQHEDAGDDRNTQATSVKADSAANKKAVGVGGKKKRADKLVELGGGASQQQAARSGDNKVERSASMATGDPALQLEILQQITGLMSSQAGVHHVFIKAVEGMQLAVGFDRAILCLLSADHSQLIGRIALGSQAESLKEYFNLPVREQRNMFIKILREGNELCVENSKDMSWRSTLPETFHKKVAAPAFMIGALRAGSKPVGLFYADNAVSRRPITSIAQQGFLQFLNQARLALQVAELSRR